MVAYKLKGGARVCWDRIQSIKKHHGELPIVSWEWMRKLMYDQFLPVDYQQTLFKQYHYCQQGQRNVANYVDEFQELGVKNDLSETKSQEILRFITGLHEPLRSKVDITNAMSFPEALILATKYEN